MKIPRLIAVGVSFSIASAVIAPPDAISQVTLALEMAVIYGLLTLAVSRLRLVTPAKKGMDTAKAVLVCLLSVAVAYVTTLFWHRSEGSQSSRVLTSVLPTIDDFESYDDGENRIYDTWVDDFSASRNGSQVGWTEAPIAETRFVNSGSQSMPLSYDNTSGGVSETKANLGSQNWIGDGTKALMLHVRGYADNDPARLYVGIRDRTNHTGIVAHPDPNVATVTNWTEWRIPFSEFSGINMAKVTTMYIGLGDRDTPTHSGAGIIYIDDIQLTAEEPPTREGTQNTGPSELSL